MVQWDRREKPSPVSAPSKSESLPFRSCPGSQHLPGYLGGESQRWPVWELRDSLVLWRAPGEGGLSLRGAGLPLESNSIWVADPTNRPFLPIPGLEGKLPLWRHSLWAFYLLGIKEKHVWYRFQEQSIKQDSTRLLLVIMPLETPRKEQSVRISKVTCSFNHVSLALIS